MQLVWITALGVGGATVIGALIGFLLKKIPHRFNDAVLGFAAGVMLAAAVLGLIVPSLEYGGKYGILITIVGIFIGALCLNLIDKVVPHLHKLMGSDIESHNNANLNKVLLFVTAIAIHNLPEGIAAGVGAGSGSSAEALFIAGGIGLAPLRSVINYVIDNRENYGTVDILYGSRSADDLVGLKEIREVWMNTPGINVHLTIDREQEGWDGHVGFVPSYLKELEFSNDKTALVCGPPIMIKFVLQALGEMGFTKEQVYTTLELRMKCGVGKCGRCNIGSKYVCKDGPVFRFDEIDELPNEY